MQKEVSLNKSLYKLQLYTLKVIPMAMAFMFWLNTLLSYLYIDFETFSYIGGVSFITLFYLYIASYTFKFCIYHRLFLHYIVIIQVLEMYDIYLGIPLDRLPLFIMYQIISGISLFLIIYSHVKTRKISIIKNSR